MQDMGLNYSLANLETAYREAKGAGLLHEAVYSPQEQQAFPHMSTAQLKAYIEQKYQQPEKINYADYLPQFGERSRDIEPPDWTPERSAELIAKLQRQRKAAR